MTDLLTVDRQHTALLIMDFQNEVVAGFAAGQPELLARTADALGAARAAGLAIIYIVVQFREGYPEISPRNRVFAAIRASGRMLAGSPGSEVHAQVAPRAGEIVIAKQRVGAFSTTNLETILRAQEITTLALCGIATSGVVLSTVRWAADSDYELVILEDCCADRDDEVHRVLMQKIFPRQAEVVSAQQFIAVLA